MSRTIGIGVVGVGFGQQVHAPAFRLDERCRVVAVSASSHERACTAAARLGIARAHGGWEELLQDPEVDAVTVAVPPVLQASVVMAAARRGKPVFCEKPVAANLEQAQAMLAAVQQANVAHAVDFLFPEIPAWQKAKAILDSRALGRLRHAALTWRVEIAALRRRPDSWKLRAQEGGGALFSFASHSLFYLEWLFGPIESLAARLSPAPPACDLRVEAWLDFASGLSASLSVATDAFLGSGHRLEVYGDEGALVLENATSDHAGGFQLRMGTRAGGALQPVPLVDLALPAGGDGRVWAAAAIARRLVDAVLGGPPATPNLTHGVRVQHLMEKMRAASQREGRQAV